MAFFGLTTLGVQNPFHTCQETPLSVFSREDFATAWKTVTQGDEYLRTSELSQVLRALYHCPEGDEAPTRAMQAVQRKFANQEHTSMDEFLTKMAEIVAQGAEEDGVYCDKSSEFVSSEEYRAAMGKHARMNQGPREKYSSPLSTGQMYGWTQPKEMPARKPKKSCEETKFASAMVQAGMYYS